MSKPATVTAQLVAFTTASFLGFLAIGIPLPALAVFVHDSLGFSAFAVGVVIGTQSLATLLTRQYAGRLSDTGSPKRATLAGFACASGAGLLYLCAQAMVAQPRLSLTLLLAGRLLLGLGESLFITALVAWSIVRVGAQNAGRAMAWSGISMYGALALGAPLGLLVLHAGGFGAVAACAIVSPLLGAALIFTWTDAEPAGARAPLSLLRVFGRIWAPGLAMALASSGVGTISAFLTLRYQIEGWAGAGYALTGFGGAYIGMRLLFAGLPDRIGGKQTGAASLTVEALGLMVIWHSTSSWMTFAGATLTGLGYSLVFPSMGIEAMKRVASEHRGLVLGAFLACFDLGLALAGPGAGLVARLWGIPAAFLAAALAAITGLMLVLAGWLAAKPRS
ncbi:MAG: hypothetical protein JWN73_2829 [Betaproteobacteria bacterium]|nr:hypothetical protein [Betaproteobacteria bacterium]